MLTRLLNYLLNIILVLAFLIIIVPFALLAANPNIRAVLNPKDDIGSTIPTTGTTAVPDHLQFFHEGGSVAAMVVFMIVAGLLLFLQQFLWFKATINKNKFPVPKKWLVQYRYVGVLAALMILVAFVLGMVAWAVPIGITHDTTMWRKFYYTREHLYIAFIVIIGVIGVAIMGYSAYINLQIAYDQQIQFVDEGIREGKYDPVTRKPYPQVVSETKVGGDSITMPGFTSTSENHKSDSNTTTTPEVPESADPHSLPPTGNDDQNDKPKATAGFMGGN